MTFSQLSGSNLSSSISVIEISNLNDSLDVSYNISDEVSTVEISRLMVTTLVSIWPCKGILGEQYIGFFLNKLMVMDGKLAYYMKLSCFALVPIYPFIRVIMYFIRSLLLIINSSPPGVGTFR